MQLTLIDWLIIIAYFAFNLAIGFYYRKKATGSVSDYFVSGRNVTWWLAGTSMVATTFAADTPLAVTGLTARNGIAGNWIWWSMVFSGMLTVFFYAKLWRRAGVLTDVEFAEFRYSGKPAAFLRGFRALYLGLPINLIIMGWVNLAMIKILSLILGVDKIYAVYICIGIMVLTASISTTSWIRSMVSVLPRSVPGGAYSDRSAAMTPRCQECSALFSRRDSPTILVRRSTCLSLSTSTMKSSWRRRRGSVTRLSTSSTVARASHPAARRRR